MQLPQLKYCHYGKHKRRFYKFRYSTEQRFYLKYKMLMSNTPHRACGARGGTGV